MIMATCIHADMPSLYNFMASVTLLWSIMDNAIHLFCNIIFMSTIFWLPLLNVSSLVRSSMHTIYKT